MAIISESNTRKRRYGSSQVWYALTYILITTVVLLVLNISYATASQQLFYKSKQEAMTDKIQLVSSELNRLEQFTPETVAESVSPLDSLRLTRLIITDADGVALYDSMGDAAVGRCVLFSEVVAALEGNDVFVWRYQDSAMTTCASAPLLSYNQLVGSVYMMEYDTDQGEMIESLQYNVLRITLVLELVVLLFSLLFSQAFSRRIRQIMASIRIIREGDYSHRVAMGGRDELTVLGDEFNELTERLQESEQTRRQFVSDASHELKTPLAAIKLLSDSILQNEMDGDTIREFVGDIGQEADRLTRMSQKLLSLSKVDSQASDESRVTLVAPTLERVVHMVSALAVNAQVTLVPQVEQDCPIRIAEDDLYQIIFNLAENGIKYNRPGGTLTLSLSQAGGSAVLKVADSGMGIPEASLDQIFKRFYRVDKARSRQTGGSGLGLAIVHDLVVRSHGTIDVESVLGQGTVFTVTFPISQEVQP